MKNRNTISVCWEVDDGYCGGAAPQHTSITTQEIEECETLEDAVKLVEDAIEDDFRNHANPSWDSDRIRSQIEEVWNNRPKDDE